MALWSFFLFLETSTFFPEFYYQLLGQTFTCDINQTDHFHLLLLHFKPPAPPQDSPTCSWTKCTCKLNLLQLVTWLSSLTPAVFLIFHVILFESARQGWVLITSFIFIPTNMYGVHLFSPAKELRWMNQWGARHEQLFALWNTTWDLSLHLTPGWGCSTLTIHITGWAAFLLS